MTLDPKEAKCARCGFPRSEHHYNGACYGICGGFSTAPSGQAPLEGVVREIWDDATNSVCQTMQDSEMCKCEDGKCVAAGVHPDPKDIAYHTRSALLPASAEPVACHDCKGTGTVAEYIGSEMSCVEVECSTCKGAGVASPPASGAVEAGGLQPTHWHCKDYADGWISFDTEAEALEYQRETGCLLRVVYRPAAPTEGR